MKDILPLDTLRHRVVNPGMKKMKGVTYQKVVNDFKCQNRYYLGPCPGVLAGAHKKGLSQEYLLNRLNYPILNLMLVCERK